MSCGTGAIIRRKIKSLKEKAGGHQFHYVQDTLQYILPVNMLVSYFMFGSSLLFLDSWERLDLGGGAVMLLHYLAILQSSPDPPPQKKNMFSS